MPHSPNGAQQTYHPDTLELPRLNPCFDTRIKPLPDFIKANPPCRSLKKLATARPFNRTQLATDRRLGDIASCSRFSETPAFGNL